MIHQGIKHYGDKTGRVGRNSPFQSPVFMVRLRWADTYSMNLSVTVLKWVRLRKKPNFLKTSRDREGRYRRRRETARTLLKVKMSIDVNCFVFVRGEGKRGGDLEDGDHRETENTT